MGCFKHIENVLDPEEKPYTYVQLHHYMARFVPKQAKSFGMKQKKTRSFRPNWPKPTKHLNKPVNPSIYQHPELGPCIVCCGSHLDTSLDFLHVPVHPVLGSHSNPNNNWQAPVNIFPNLAKVGSTWKSNTSYNTVKMHGNVSGVSTCYLAPAEATDMSKFSIDDMKASTLTFNKREEIYVSAQRGFHRDEAIKLANWNGWTREERAYIEECGRTGTTVNQGDILHLIKSSNQKGVGNSMAINNVSFQVHPSDEWGAKPPTLPKFLTGSEKSPLTNSMFCVISLLLANKALYYKFVKKSRETPGASYKRINKIIQLVNNENEESEHLRRDKMTKTFDGIIRSFDEEYPINEHTSALSLTGEILKHLLGNDIFLNVSNSDEYMLNDDEYVLFD